MQGQLQIAVVVADRVVHCDQLGAIGEGALNLHLDQCLGHSGHDLAAAQELLTKVHEVGDRVLAVANELCKLTGDQGSGFCLVETQSSGESLLSQAADLVEDELVQLAWNQFHGKYE